MMGRLREIDLRNACRLCLSDFDKKSGVNIYSDCGALASEIERLLQVKMSRSDGKSTVICRSCYTNVRTIQQFTILTKECEEVTEFLYKSASMTGFMKQILHLPKESCFNSQNKIKIISSKVSTEVEDLSPSSNKYTNICPFCKSDDLKNNVSSKSNSKIRLCTKHNKPYTCLVPNCNIIFPTLDVFLQHYRFHLQLPINNSVCHTCFEVLNRSKILMDTEHKHKDLSELMACCSKIFSSMTDFAMHKFMKHSATVSMMHLEISAGFNTCSPRFVNKCLKDEPEVCVAKIDTPETSSIIGTNDIYSDAVGNYSCKLCGAICFSVKAFVEHFEKKHNRILSLKESGIKLCPLCDLNYSIENFDEHIHKCTNTMLISNDLTLNHFGCVICKAVFDDVSPKQFRYHFLYCKSFQRISYKGVAIESCINCNFKSTNHSTSLLHANSSCIYFQLKMKYAYVPSEKVENKIKSNENDDEDDYLNSDSSIFHPSSLSQMKVNPIYEAQDTIKVKPLCYPTIRKDIEDYNYLCNNCGRTFYSYTIFQKHLIYTGEMCRAISLWYCQWCCTDFSDLNEYDQHFEQPIEAPDSLEIKIEPEPTLDSDEIIDYRDDNIMDVPARFEGEESECESEKLSVLLQRQEEITPVDEKLSSLTLLSFQEPGPSKPHNFNEDETLSFRGFEAKAKMPISEWD